MILIRPEKEETVYTRVFLKNERLQDSKTAEQFLMAYGLNGMVVDSGFLMSTARMLLLIFPGIVLGALFLKANQERRLCTVSYTHLRGRKYLLYACEIRHSYFGRGFRRD